MQHSAWMCFNGFMAASLCPLGVVGGPILMKVSHPAFILCCACMYVSSYFLVRVRSLFVSLLHRRVVHAPPFHSQGLQAALATGAIVGSLSAIAAASPSDRFLNMGGALGVGLGCMFAASIGTRPHFSSAYDSRDAQPFASISLHVAVLR